MYRAAFKMRLKSGFEKEYKRRHDEIWPELVRLLEEAGVRDYSIFLDEETGDLYAVQKLTQENTAGSLGQTDLMQRWWDYMADIMEVNPDNSPVQRPLREVFHMD